MKLSSCWSCWEPEKTKGGGTIQYVSSICLEMTSISWLKLRVFPILLGARLERDMCVKTKPNCVVSPLWDLTMSPSHWGIRAYRFVSPLRPCRTHTHKHQSMALLETGENSNPEMATPKSWCYWWCFLLKFELPFGIIWWIWTLNTIHYS